MRIVLIGSVDFTAHCLDHILANGGDIVGVITTAVPGNNSDWVDLVELAARRSVPAFSVHKINDPVSIELVRSLNPDILFVFGFSQLIGRELLAIPKRGAIGTHPALLPRNRGRHPLIWALVEGLHESGLTFFHMDDGADSGDILWQRPFAITLDDDATTLYRKVKDLAAIAIPEFLPQLVAGNAPRIPQDSIQASYWRKRSEADGKIRWEAPAMETYNLVRALTRPYPGAHTFVRGEKLIVWKAELPVKGRAPGDPKAEPGTVVSATGRRLTVSTGEGVIDLVDWAAPQHVDFRDGMKLGTAPQ